MVTYSFQNFIRSLENSNFMLTTTTHLVRLQNESSNPQKVTLNTQLFQYFVVWDKNKKNKTNNNILEANFNIWETAVREQGEYILGMLVILLCYCQTRTTT